MADSKTRSKLYGVALEHKLLNQEVDQDTVDIYREYDVLSSVSMVACRSTPVKALCSPQDWTDEAKDPTATCLDCSFEDASQESPSLHKKPGCGGKPGDIEFEWQWITDQEQSATCLSSSLAEPSIPKEKSMFEVNSSMECVTKYGMSLSGCHNESTVAATGVVPSSVKSGPSSMHMDLKDPVQGGNPCWRTANEEELAILISTRSHGHLKNCDLPPSSSVAAVKRSLLANDLDAKFRNSDESAHADKLLLASLLEQYEPSSLERRSSPSSPFIVTASDAAPFKEAFCIGSQPYAVPSNSLDPVLQEDRIKKRGVRSNMETLGEALCHAQTRARYAERVAAKALLDKETVVQLLFRETWTTRTYKHWLHAFEMENMWFRREAGTHSKLCIEEGPLYSGFLYSPCIDKLVKNDRCKLPQNAHQACTTKKFWKSGGNLMMRYTIGLAFAIGLSFAGAGLMLGWRMGWIIFAY